MKKIPLKWQIVLAIVVLVAFSWWLTTEQAREMGAGPAQIVSP